MNKTIYLCKIDNIDNTYQNILDFSSASSRNNYFISKHTKSFTINVRDDGLINDLTIPINHTEINNLNYLYMTDETNKHLFFFITSYTHTTPSNTTITLQLDAWTTYQFDISFLDSFIERCHVPRWNGDTPTKNTIDEGLPLNEYMLESTQTICTYNDGLIVSSTQPLGICEGFHISNPSGGGGSTGEPSNGTITEQGFVFIKGEEGLSPYGAYLNGESFRTVGYGSTETSNLAYYNRHKPFPCSEELAAEIFAERIRDNFSKGLYDACVANGIEKKITRYQFDAMLSLSYNGGLGGFLTYNSSPWQLIRNNPNDPGIKEVWEKFLIMGGDPLVELEGLKIRRKKETNIYFSALYQTKSIGIYNENGNLTSNKVETNEGKGYIPIWIKPLSNVLNLCIE